MRKLQDFSKAFITGGAGFLGHSVAKYLLDLGLEVIVFDNFSRGQGCYHNIELLKEHPNVNNLRVYKGDVRNYEEVSNLLKDCDLIVHAAAQTSVPISVREPRLDFETNVIGTFNVLEASRNSPIDQAVIYISSNKVYGLSDMKFIELGKRYEFPNNLIEGIDESYSINPDDPYGLSKAVGEEYAKIYNLRYGLRITNLRFSLIYGPGQWGTEEQGFVTWFCITYVLGYPIRIFGSGKQVRDLLYIDDAVQAIELAIKNIDRVAGLSLNIGGGRENSVSLLELIDYLNEISGRNIKVTFNEWRPRDIRCFYTDFRKAYNLLRWRPKIEWKDGVKRTYNWVLEEIHIISQIYQSTHISP